MTNLRHKIHEVIEPASSNNIISKAYDILMLAAIVCSLTPLVTHSGLHVLVIMDIVTCVLFIIDYGLRWMTADVSSGKKGIGSFLKYPFTPMAIIDLLSILPSLSIISPAFKVLRVSRLFRIFRIFKFVRYYEPLQITIAVIRREARTLGTVMLFAVFYILICALVMFNVDSEPAFETFYDAVYWACSTLTTVGYGDLYPESSIGRAFSMISSIVGIALIALPSGIITSGYMEETRSRRENMRTNGG